MITGDTPQDDRELFMLSITNKAFMLSVVILNVIMPSVAAPLERTVSIVLKRTEFKRKQLVQTFGLYYKIVMRIVSDDGN